MSAAEIAKAVYGVSARAWISLFARKPFKPSIHRVSDGCRTDGKHRGSNVHFISAKSVQREKRSQLSHLTVRMARRAVRAAFRGTTGKCNQWLRYHPVPHPYGARSPRRGAPTCFVVRVHKFFTNLCETALDRTIISGKYQFSAALPLNAVTIQQSDPTSSTPRFNHCEKNARRPVSVQLCNQEHRVRGETRSSQSLQDGVKLMTARVGCTDAQRLLLVGAADVETK